MTTIVAVRDKDRTIFVADTQATIGGHQRQLASPKVFRRGTLVIGVSGPWKAAMHVGARLALTPPTDDADLDHWMATEFHDKTRALLEAAELWDEENGCSEATFLVGAGDQIFEVGCDLSVIRLAEDYNAIGSGYAYALGAIAAAKECTPWFQAESMARIAVEAAARFDIGTSLPLTVVTLEHPAERLAPAVVGA
jgi:ATP-dependent protease HslVU (ClpYQ) peptidase subunit